MLLRCQTLNFNGIKVEKSGIIARSKIDHSIDRSIVEVDTSTHRCADADSGAVGWRRTSAVSNSRKEGRRMRRRRDEEKETGEGGGHSYTSRVR